MTWINQPLPSRLKVWLEGQHLIKFEDRETGESVTVFAPPNFEDVTMTVNRDSRTVTRALDNAVHFLKGKNGAARNVFHYVSRQHATALRAGLTVHRSLVSSTPHGFERTPESGFEEVFYFLLPDGGKGVLEGEGLWPDGRKVDAMWPVRDGQFAQIPMGWHRVVALPDADGQPPRLGYIWAYLCTRREWEKD